MVYINNFPSQKKSVNACLIVFGCYLYIMCGSNVIKISPKGFALIRILDLNNQHKSLSRIDLLHLNNREHVRGIYVQYNRTIQPMAVVYNRNTRQSPPLFTVYLYKLSYLFCNTCVGKRHFDRLTQRSF